MTRTLRGVPRLAPGSQVEVAVTAAEIVIVLTPQTLPVVGTATVGPSGPPGPTAVSTNANNYARLGTDGLLHVPITVGPTAPSSPFVGQLWVDTT
jgi:hypothetical protein